MGWAGVLPWSLPRGKGSVERIRRAVSLARLCLALVLGLAPSSRAAAAIDSIEAPTTGDEGTPLTFRAQASDAGTAALSYTWDWGDGTPASTGAEASHAFADNGTYHVTLTVVDADGASSSTSGLYTIHNLPPVPEQLEEQVVETGRVFSLRLQAHDAAGPEDPLTWTLLEGPGALSPDGVYTWDTPQGPKDVGLHTVRARVADGDGGQAELVFQLEVPRPDFERPPGCGCGATPGAGAPVMLALLALASVARRRTRG